MTATITKPLTVANGGLRESPRWGNGRQDPVARALAPKWRLTAKSAERQLCGPDSVFNRCADALREMKVQGCENRLARATRDLLSALEGREAPPLVAATWHIAQEADAAEDVAELDYQQDPSDKNLERLICAKDRAIVREMALRDALKAEQDRRRV